MVVDINLHPTLATSDVEKRKIFFNPHPPNAFGKGRPLMDGYEDLEYLTK
jgi:hypothetical protein